MFDKPATQCIGGGIYKPYPALPVSTKTSTHLRVPYLPMLRVLVLDGAGHAVVRHAHHAHSTVVERGVRELRPGRREPDRVVGGEDFLWNVRVEG